MKFKYVLWSVDAPMFEPAYHEIVDTYTDPQQAWEMKMSLEEQEQDKDVYYQVVIEPLEGDKEC